MPSNKQRMQPDQVQPKSAQKAKQVKTPKQPAPVSKSKRPKGDPKNPDFATVVAIGAPPNTRLRGITKEEGKLFGVTSDDAIASVGDGAAVLEIVYGAIAPRASQVKACLDAYGQDGWSAKLGAKMRLTAAKAGLLRAAAPPQASRKNRKLS